MQLLTQQLIKELPKFYETEQIAIAEKTAMVRLFHRASNWTWYIVEFDGNDMCWGLVSGKETLFGEFSLSELSRETCPFGLGIKRDKLFKPTKINDLAAFSKARMTYY